MIDNKSLDNAFGMADKLAEKGIVLDTLDTSALQHIVSDMRLLPESGEIDSDAWREAIKRAAQNDDHDGAIGIIADNAAKSVLNTHRLVTDVINPQVRKLTDEITKKVNEACNNQSTSIVNVKYMSIPTTLELGTFKEAVQKIASMDLYEVDRSSVGTYTQDEIIELIKFSNVDDFDEVLSSWVRENPKEVSIINDVLSNKRPVVSKVDPLSTMGLSVLVLLTQSLAYTDTIKEGLNISLSNYKNNLFHISTLAAVELSDLVYKWNHLIGARHIYKPGENLEKEITLVQPVVVELFKHGVTVEHLIGNHLLGRPFQFQAFTSSDEEIKNKALSETMAEYDRVSKIQNVDADTKRVDLCMRIALTSIRDEAIELSHDPVALARLGDTKETMVARANAACESIYKSGKKLDMDKLGEFVAGVVISIYYAHTDALIYMDSLADFATQYPEMNVVDLAKMARAALVVNWVCRQLAVSK